MRPLVVAGIGVAMLVGMLVLSRLVFNMLESTPPARPGLSSAPTRSALDGVSRPPADSFGTAPNALAAPGVVPTEQITWVPVGEWSGDSSQDTPTFPVASREWRVLWSMRTRAAGAPSSLLVSVHDPSGALVSMAVDTREPGVDASHVFGGSGRFYLKVAATNADWAVKVEDQR